MEAFHAIIGRNPETIEWWQMVCRAVIIFFFALFAVRFGGKRVFGKSTSFDIVLGVILGSILSRAMTANASFFPTMAAAAALVLLHRLLAKLAFYNKTIGHLIKGKEAYLVENGHVNWKEMKKNSITSHDLSEALRIKGSTLEMERLKEAVLERSGDMSIVTFPECEDA